MTAWLPIDTTPRDFAPAAITDAEGAAEFAVEVVDGRADARLGRREGGHDRPG